MTRTELKQKIHSRVFSGTMNKVATPVHNEVSGQYPGQRYVENPVWDPVDDVLFVLRDQIEDSL